MVNITGIATSVALATSFSGPGRNMTTTTAPVITGSSIAFDTGQDYVFSSVPFCSRHNASGSSYYKGPTTAAPGRVGGSETPSTHSEPRIIEFSEPVFDESGYYRENSSDLVYGTEYNSVRRNERGVHRQKRASRNASDHVTINDVKYFTYGILWPSICGLGIIGNILNLVVLNQPNMKGTAYIYMRGYSSAALMAITVAIPFANRILHKNERGPWANIYQAFFHTYLELYLGNSCLGIGVMMLVALTMERFVAVCHPEKSRALQGSKKAYIIIASIPVCTFLTYSPHLCLSTLVQCVTEEGETMYEKVANTEFTKSTIYTVYKTFLAMVFRLIPTILLAYLNLRIIVAYKRTCARRRIMTGKSGRDDNKKFAEESRIMLLLGSTSVLFFVCVTPMVILSVIWSDKLLKSFSFQVFRATANLLEVTNYSLTFYIYCLFSREFRNTFFGLLHIGDNKRTLAAGGHGATPTNKQSGGTGKASSDPTATPHQGGSTPLL